MTQNASVKKRLLVAGVTLVVAAFGVVLAARSLLDAIDRSKLKRSLADVRSIATVLQNYHRDHGSYPATFDLEEFRRAVAPEYIHAM